MLKYVYFKFYVHCVDGVIYVSNSLILVSTYFNVLCINLIILVIKPKHSQLAKTKHFPGIFCSQIYA